MKIIRLYGAVIAVGGALLLAGCGGGGPGKNGGKDSGMRGMAMGDSGMDLVKKETTAPRVKGIGLEELLRPADGFVISSVAVTSVSRDTVQPELAVLGTIGYDTRLQYTIAGRVSGRIEKLYVRYRYQHVHQGQRIMDIYSPELATGEQEYLYLLRNDPGNTALVAAARERLLLLGVSGEQLAEVAKTGKASATLGVYSPYTGHIHEAGNTMPGPETETETGAAPAAGGMTEELPVKEGMYVDKGQAIFQVFNMDRGWALLRLFPGQGAMVRKGDPVEIVPETAPDKAFAGRVDLVEPLYRTGDRSLTARVYFDNSVRDIPIGSAVKATIRPDVVVGRWLPKAAVLSLGTDRVVFLRADGGFRAHRVATGLADGDRIQVLSGLSDGDVVAANAQFLVDSEDFIKIKS